jgi:chromosome partitioning protein
VTGSIITIASMKGGSGKSTLASCIAVYWHLRGHHCAIMDADPQRSIVRLAARERALGGLTVVEDATEASWTTARRLAGQYGRVIIDTPGFRSDATLALLGESNFVVVPLKPSPVDVDRMLDTLNILIKGGTSRAANFCCLLTQTTRDSVISKQIRRELIEAGFPVLRHEMTNRVVYAEAALWGGTPNLVDAAGPAAQDIARIAEEIDGIVESIKDFKRVASA